MSVDTRLLLDRLTRTISWYMCVSAVLLLGASTRAATSEPSPDDSFRLALPGYRYEFPRDHGSHDEFRTEWWYYTGHLVTDSGRRFGYQLTFFRRGIERGHRPPNPSRWAIRQLYLAHFALTDVDRGEFRYAEKVSRSALGKAGADAGRLHSWIDRWSVEASASKDAGHRLRASTAHVAIDLHVTPEKTPVIHGLEGVSRKGDQPGQASHYYSLTRLATEGRVTVDGQTVRVSGHSWMDHEFGSAELGRDLVGWDWFSIQLQDRSELMCYLLRRADGSPDGASSGTFVFSDGRARHLVQEDVNVKVLEHWASKASGATYPSRWRLTVPSLELSLELVPLVADQELRTGKSTQVTYWEGAVTASGRVRGEEIGGHGYVELTGYAEPFGKRL